MKIIDVSEDGFRLHTLSEIKGYHTGELAFIPAVGSLVIDHDRELFYDVRSLDPLTKQATLKAWIPSANVIVDNLGTLLNGSVNYQVSESHLLYVDINRLRAKPTQQLKLYGPQVSYYRLHLNSNAIKPTSIISLSPGSVSGLFSDKGSLLVETDGFIFNEVKISRAVTDGDVVTISVHGADDRVLSLVSVIVKVVPNLPISNVPAVVDVRLVNNVLSSDNRYLEISTDYTPEIEIVYDNDTVVVKGVDNETDLVGLDGLKAILASRQQGPYRLYLKHGDFVKRYLAIKAPAIQNTDNPTEDPDPEPPTNNLPWKPDPNTRTFHTGTQWESQENNGYILLYTNGDWTDDYRPAKSILTVTAVGKLQVIFYDTEGAGIGEAVKTIDGEDTIDVNLYWEFGQNIGGLLIKSIDSNEPAKIKTIFFDEVTPHARDFETLIYTDFTVNPFNEADSPYSITMPFELDIEPERPYNGFSINDIVPYRPSVPMVRSAYNGLSTLTTVPGIDNCGWLFRSQRIGEVFESKQFVFEYKFRLARDFDRNYDREYPYYIPFGEWFIAIVSDYYKVGFPSQVFIECIHDGLYETGETGVNYSPTNWNHFAVKMDNERLQVFLNSVLVMDTDVGSLGESNVSSWDVTHPVYPQFGITCDNMSGLDPLNIQSIDITDIGLYVGDHPVMRTGGETNRLNTNHYLNPGNFIPSYRLYDPVYQPKPSKPTATDVSSVAIGELLLNNTEDYFLNNNGGKAISLRHPVLLPGSSLSSLNALGVLADHNLHDYDTSYPSVGNVVVNGESGKLANIIDSIKINGSAYIHALYEIDDPVLEQHKPSIFASDDPDEIEWVDIGTTLSSFHEIASIAIVPETGGILLLVGDMSRNYSPYDIWYGDTKTPVRLLHKDVFNRVSPLTEFSALERSRVGISCWMGHIVVGCRPKKHTENSVSDYFANGGKVNEAVIYLNGLMNNDEPIRFEGSGSTTTVGRYQSLVYWLLNIGYDSTQATTLFPEYPTDYNPLVIPAKNNDVYVRVS